MTEKHRKTLEYTEAYNKGAEATANLITKAVFRLVLAGVMLIAYMVWPNNVTLFAMYATAFIAAVTILLTTLMFVMTVFVGKKIKELENE